MTQGRDHTIAIDALHAKARAVAAANPIPDGKPASVTILHGTDRSTIVVGSIRAGGGFRPHVHEHHDEVLVYLEGRADVRLGDTVRTVEAGDFVVAPAGAAHATVHAHDPCLLVAIFSPRFDWGDGEDRVYVD